MNKITRTDLRNFDYLFISSEWNIDDEGHAEFRNEIFVVEPSQYDDWYNLLRYNLNTTKTPLMLNKQWIELQRKNFYGHMKIMCREMRLNQIAGCLTEDIYASMRRKKRLRVNYHLNIVSELLFICIILTITIKK